MDNRYIHTPLLNKALVKQYGEHLDNGTMNNLPQA